MQILPISEITLILERLRLHNPEPRVQWFELVASKSYGHKHPSQSRWPQTPLTVQSPPIEWFELVASKSGVVRTNTVRNP